MINQPEVDWETGQIMPVLNTADMWDFGDYNYDIYRTEIARRGSLLVQPLSNVADSQLTAMLMFKQGLLNQGGPADIMVRRVVNNPDEEDPSYNPYGFANLVCDETLYTDGTNPYYPGGICMAPAINLSAVAPEECTSGGGGDNDISDGVCPEVDADGVLSQDPEDNTAFDKVTTWYQCPGSDLCETDESNLDDQSWNNPLDVAKGHRGYLWGNMVVTMYAWSPNWKLNAKGSDRYELYIRRSFDGGQTWTTTPADWGGMGTTTCEWMRDGETAADATQRCTGYAAGDPEQARNVSQLVGAEGTPTNNLTVLDPRYAPDPATMPSIGEDTDEDGVVDTVTYADSDEFNPSRFFVVFETGDNTTVAEGEAEPLDMSYGRAINFGDYYQAVELSGGGEPTAVTNFDEVDLLGTCSGGSDDGAFCNYFARLNTGTTTGSEASLAMSPAGDHLYTVWSQHNYETDVFDAQYARTWYTDAQNDWTVGTGDMPDAYPPADDDVIGGGDDTYVPPGDDGDGDGDGDGGDGNGGGSKKGGCTIASGDAAFDPLLPAIVLLALGYLGLRRRSAKASH
jgi:hypothetical protein